MLNWGTLDDSTKYFVVPIDSRALCSLSPAWFGVRVLQRSLEIREALSQAETLQIVPVNECITQNTPDAVLLVLAVHH
jgi:hypothetical protein